MKAEREREREREREKEREREQSIDAILNEGALISFIRVSLWFYTGVKSSILCCYDKGKQFIAFSSAIYRMESFVLGI